MVAVGLVITMLLCSLSVFATYESSEAGQNGSMILVDEGNGSTTWIDITTETGDTYTDVLNRVLDANGFDYEYDGTISINGKTSTVIGSADTGGTVRDSGSTGVTETSSWRVFEWSNDEWTIVPDIENEYAGGHFAIAFYPSENVIPVETPDNMSSWTMVRGDSEQTGNQTTSQTSSEEAAIEWTVRRGGTSGVYASVLSVQGYLFVKFGASYSASMNIDPAVICYSLDGEEIWRFSYSGINSYETATPLIVGDYIFIPTTEGYIYRMPWLAGPGENNENVVKNTEVIPLDTGADLTGYTYNVGPGSLVYDSGAIYFMSTNGMVYCYSMDLELIWSYQMGGHMYYISPTVYDDYVFVGALNGHIYVIDKATGELIDEELVYTRTVNGKEYGSVNAISVFEDEGRYLLMFGVSDGRGMDSQVGGIGIYRFDGTSLTKVSLEMESFGLVSNYLLTVNNDDFTGVYFPTTKGLFRVSTDGRAELLNDSIESVKAPAVLVNGTSIYLVSYQPSKPIYQMELDGTILAMWTPSTTVNNYGMSPVVIINDYIFIGNDAGFIAIDGVLPEYVAPNEAGGLSTLQKLLIFVIIIFAIIALTYVILKFVKKIEKPFSYLRKKGSDYLGSETMGHNTRSRHRLLVMILVGVVLTIAVFIACLCIGPTMTMSIGDMFSSLISAIQKGGEGLAYNELMVYESRLPRTLAALGVGIGLAVAGCMYQAIIRNPLVDPYIMGVSSGAGTAAVAVIAFDFTFFGLFSAHSIYLTAFTAMIGGLLAFVATMFIAEKAGGNSLNYVLAGVVVGLAFSAVQTLMLSMAGSDVSNALAWLYGSFANVTWSQVWLVLIPAIVLSMVPLIWAKEFNLVLLGEDQAQQMGLNVRKFNRIMLILASILTSLCVAFVGIIGFVGLVIPHLCRMILGGDHRLVLPASIALGGALMMFADLMSRMILVGHELPVGAITTVIGVPVFAYLLIKRGKMYDG